LALNSLTNQDALDRLLGANGSGFAQPHTVRFFPSTTLGENQVTPLPGVTAHVLGPSRDQARLKRMDPPKSAGWLRLGIGGDGTGASSIGHLFAAGCRVPDEKASEELRAARKSLNLTKVTNDAGSCPRWRCWSGSSTTPASSSFSMSDDDALQLLFSHYSSSSHSDLRNRVLLVVHTAVTLAVDDGLDTVTEGVMSVAISETAGN
jgi:hypothetical protein